MAVNMSKRVTKNYNVYHMIVVFTFFCKKLTEQIIQNSTIVVKFV